MLSEISMRQFAEWQAYAQLEPFDEERNDLRAASIVQTLLNLHRKKGRPAYKLKDCALRFVEARPKVLTEQAAEEARQEVLKTMDVLMRTYNAPEPKKVKKASR